MTTIVIITTMVAIIINTGMPATTTATTATSITA
jgi:hypothetical protein